jgi:glutamate-1-semialdehyde 2,1-aminomutase
VITGFRFSMGGAAEYYGITPPPDLLTMAKMLGGGLPVAAVAGRRDVLGSGATAHNTQSSNPVTHAAAVAALEQLSPELYRGMNRLGARLRDGLREAFADVRLRIQVTGDGTNAGIHLVPVEVPDAETARGTDLQLFNLFRLGMLNRGMNWTTRGFGVTGAFVEDDVETTITDFRDTALALRPLLADVAPELLA